MKHTTVIDIGSSKVSCMSAGTAADGALVIHGIESRRYPGYRLGSLPRSAGLIEALDSALAALQENTGLHIRSVSVGVPAPFVRTAVTYGEIEVDSRNNRVTAADMDWLFDTASDFELPEGYELMHSTPFDYRLDGAPCDGDPIGLPADKLAASFCHAFVDRRFASLVTGILDGFGITVSSFVSCSMACSASEGVQTPGANGKPHFTASFTTVGLNPGATANFAPASKARCRSRTFRTVPAPR